MSFIGRGSSLNTFSHLFHTLVQHAGYTHETISLCCSFYLYTTKISCSAPKKYLQFFTSISGAIPESFYLMKKFLPERIVVPYQKKCFVCRGVFIQNAHFYKPQTKNKPKKPARAEKCVPHPIYFSLLSIFFPFDPPPIFSPQRGFHAKCPFLQASNQK